METLNIALPESLKMFALEQTRMTQDDWRELRERIQKVPSLERR